jgi:hypothetical protein
MLVAAGAALAARLLTGPHPIDDAYITFRYARNLAEGLGLVYNPGEWVLGTTTPLWALILGLGYRLGWTDLPSLASSLAAVCDALSAALLVGLSARLGWGGRGAAGVGLAWALNPMSIAFAVGGMETSLFVTLCLSALSLAATQRLAWAGLLSGVSCLVRPEGLLLGLVCVAWSTRRGRRGFITSGALVGVPVVVAASVFLAVYGSPLPHSMAAKQAAYRAHWPLENALAMIIQAGLPGWSTYLLSVLPAAAGLLLAAAGLTGLLALGRLSFSTLRSHGLGPQPFVAFGGLYVLFYVAVGFKGVRLFPWYLVPIIPFYILLASAGLARLSQLRPRFRTSMASLAGLIVVWQLPAVDWRQPLLPIGSGFGREQVLLEAGQALRVSLPADAVVAAPEIGALGYASTLRILDTVGLVSPAALPYYPVPEDQVVPDADNAIPPRLIRDQRPEAVVTMDAFARRSLLLDGGFRADYRLEASYPADVWASHELWVFRRVPAVTGTAAP